MNVMFLAGRLSSQFFMNDLHPPLKLIVTYRDFPRLEWLLANCRYDNPNFLRPSVYVVQTYGPSHTSHMAYSLLPMLPMYEKFQKYSRVGLNIQPPCVRILEQRSISNELLLEICLLCSKLLIW